MAPKIALLVGLAFSAWLFAYDLRRRTGVSQAFWIPWLWLAIVSTRPACVWLGVGMGDGDAYSEGTPLDRTIYLGLIVAGLFVLTKRRAQWGRIIAANKWLFIFFLYWGLSVLWSDYPFVSFKRWIKDAGNVVMVLVMLSEIDPVDAVKAVFARCGYLFVPLSVVFIKYFPDLGRAYNHWTWEYMYVGVTLNKNSLGVLVLVSALFIMWDFVTEKQREAAPPLDQKQMVARWALLLMCAWLLHMAHSATSTVCTLLGAGVLLAFRLPFFRRRPRGFSTYVVVGALAFSTLDSVFNLREVLVRSVGRDMTFTTRTDMWDLVLRQNFDPIFGTGFMSFWMGQRLQAIWAVFEGVNQSHNGYLETYLNGGLIALILLIGCIIATYIGIRVDLLRGSDFAKMRLALWLVALLYNVTEAAFNRLSPIWLVFLLATVRLPARAKVAKSASAGAVPPRARAFAPAEPALTS